MMMKRGVVLLFIILSSLFTAAAFAQNSIKAEVDKTALSTGEVLTYKLTVSSLEKEIPQAELHKFTGFKVLSSAQSSSVTFAKGNVKTIIVYTVLLIPTGAGTFKIEPATVRINNETFSTGAFEIEVKQGKPKSGSPKKPSLPRQIPPEETEESPRVTL